MVERIIQWLVKLLSVLKAPSQTHTRTETTHNQEMHVVVNPSASNDQEGQAQAQNHDADQPTDRFLDICRCQHDAVETSRRIEALVCHDASDWRSHIREISIFCDQYVRLIATTLAEHPNQFTATVKWILRPADQPEPVVTTVGRSRPDSNRPSYAWPKDVHRVSENSVFASLCGIDDGETHWTQFKCFHCPDLTAQSAHFMCTRKHWQYWYKSTLVFPLNQDIFDQVTNQPSFHTLGFLTIDSQSPHVFGPLPDIFDYVGSPLSYRGHLGLHHVYQVGGTAADGLSIALSRFTLPVQALS